MLGFCLSSFLHQTLIYQTRENVEAPDPASCLSQDCDVSYSAVVLTVINEDRVRYLNETSLKPSGHLWQEMVDLCILCLTHKNPFIAV